MVDDPNTPDENNGFHEHEENHDTFFEEGDDFLAAERYDEGDFTPNKTSEKLNFKEVWEKNPSVKIFAVVAGVAFLLIGYMVFGGSSEKKEDFSVVRQTGDVSQPPGTAELPPAYEEAVRQESERRAEQALASQGSSIPTPIARPSERIEAPVQVEEVDPLSAWRREAEARRAEEKQQKETEQLTLEDLTKQPDLPPVSENTQAPPTAGGYPPPGGFQPQAAVPQNPPLPTSPSPEMIQALAQQMGQQMQTVMETQIPRESVVVSMNIQPGYNMVKYFPPEEEAQQGAARNAQGGVQNASGRNMPPQEQPLPIVQAGTIAYAQILTEANSDVPGPVLAEVASGPFVGGRAIGQFQVAQEHLVLQFSRIVKDGKEYPIQGFALDPGTTLPGIVSRIDNHYFQRVFLPAAARFVQGFADAATRTASETVVTSGTVVTTNQNKLNTKEQVFEGMNRGAQEVSRVLEQGAQRPRTVIVYAGTRIGLLFLSSVFDPNAVNGAAQQGNIPGQPASGNTFSNYSQAGQAAYNAYNSYANPNQGSYQSNFGGGGTIQPSQYNYNVQVPTVPRTGAFN